jgi:hypothetical protein
MRRSRAQIYFEEPLRLVAVTLVSRGVVDLNSPYKRTPSKATSLSSSRILSKVMGMKCSTLHLAPNPAANEPVKTNRRERTRLSASDEKVVFAIEFFL